MEKMRDEKSRKVHVSKLAKETGEEQLKSYFERFGEIGYGYVVMNVKTKKSRQFGFVMFREEEGVERCVKEGRWEIAGKEVEVKRAMLKNEIVEKKKGEVSREEEKEEVKAQNAEEIVEKVEEVVSEEVVEKK